MLIYIVYLLYLSFENKDKNKLNQPDKFNWNKPFYYPKLYYVKGMIWHWLIFYQQY